MKFEQLEKAIEDANFDQFDTDTERCLWQARVKGWQVAHVIVESLPEPGASWIHAMLHREEGDQWNAKYWYSRACKSMPAASVSYAEEWRAIAKAIL
jgi:hypothetical protein